MNDNGFDDGQSDRHKLSRRVARRLTGMVRIAPLLRSDTRFHLSVAFDDCPDTACTLGREIVERHGARATFYIATGLLGCDGVSGPITTAPRLRALAASGHEIALHTHSHTDMTHAPIAQALADIQRNIHELQGILGTDPSFHFAYPFGETTLPLKRALVDRVTTARGIHGGVNRAFADRMQLFACELGTNRPDYVATTRRLMQHAAAQGGWMILFSHDISEHPSPFGVTPAILDSLLTEAQELGAQLRPVGDAWACIADD